MTPKILFRKSQEFENEFQVAKQYFDVEECRSNCHNSLVIGRYSVLPFYKELEQDLVNQGCKLINSCEQHAWIANFNYYEELCSYTPRTWFDYNFYEAPEGKYIVKGRTNSRKLQWNKLMYADTKRRALLIANELCDDPLIGPQGIIYREYVPLKTFEVGLNDLPFTNEWRFFFLRNELVDYGYYWSNAKYIPDKKEAFPRAIWFAREIAKTVQKYVNFFVLDIAETIDDRWTLIEINDGCMSGLCTINPDNFYTSLKKVIEHEK